MPSKRRYNPKNRPSVRQKIWQSMRILRRFTIPDLCRTVPGATIANVQSFVSRLFTNEILRKQGIVKRGIPGEYQVYVLVNDSGPQIPVLATGRFKKSDNKEEREKDPEQNQIDTPEAQHDTH